MSDIRDAFPSKYLKAQDLHGKTVVVYIDRVEYEPVGQSREMKPVVYFEGKEKGLVLNKTNCNKIIQITESPLTEEWVGHPLAMYPTETSFQGEQVDCLRVKAAPPNYKRHVPDPPVDEPMHGDGSSLDGSDIPFAWLVPFALALLSGGVLA